jgi:type VI secretion system protein ImpB
MAVQDEIKKSRLTLTYRTEIQGEKAKVSLPLRLLVIGDFSLGTSSDRKVDLEERKIRHIAGTVDPLMKDMKMSLKMNVPNRVTSDGSEEMEVNLPISGMGSFTPSEIVKHVPKLKALMLLRTLLLEADSNIQNKKKLRTLVEQLYGDEAAFNKVLEELKAFEGFRLPKSS